MSVWLEVILLLSSQFPLPLAFASLQVQVHSQNTCWKIPTARKVSLELNSSHDCVKGETEVYTFLVLFKNIPMGRKAPLSHHSPPRPSTLPQPAFLGTFLEVHS